MGFKGQFAQQQSEVTHVRFGSKADIASRPSDVRFTPKSGHQDCVGLLRRIGSGSLGRIRRVRHRVLGAWLARIMPDDVCKARPSFPRSGNARLISGRFEDATGHQNDVSKDCYP